MLRLRWLHASPRPSKRELRLKSKPPESSKSKKSRPLESKNFNEKKESAKLLLRDVSRLKLSKKS